MAAIIKVYGDDAALLGQQLQIEGDLAWIGQQELAELFRLVDFKNRVGELYFVGAWHADREKF